MYPRELIMKNKIIENCLIEITDKCNLSCIQCDYPKMDKAYNFMDILDYVAILEELIECGTFRITISGGEPFLHPEIFKIIKKTTGYGFLTRVITNGSLITEEMVSKIKELPFLEIAISLHGLNEVHDNIAGMSGLFKKVEKTINLLQGGKCKIIIQTCLLKQNFKHLEEFINYIKNKNLEHLLEPYITGTNEKNNINELRLSDNDLKTYYEKYTRMNNLANEILDNKNIVRLNKCDCGITFTSMAITPECDVIPCSNFRIKAGNLKNKPLISIWKNSEIFNTLRKRHEYPRNKCKDCELLSLCSQCIALSYDEFGDWNIASTENCRHIDIIKEIYIESKQG